MGVDKNIFHTQSAYSFRLCSVYQKNIARRCVSIYSGDYYFGHKISHFHSFQIKDAHAHTFSMYRIIMEVPAILQMTNVDNWPKNGSNRAQNTPSSNIVWLIFEWISNRHVEGCSIRTRSRLSNMIGFARRVIQKVYQFSVCFAVGIQYENQFRVHNVHSSSSRISDTLTLTQIHATLIPTGFLC